MQGNIPFYMNASVVIFSWAIIIEVVTGYLFE